MRKAPRVFITQLTSSWRQIQILRFTFETWQKRGLCSWKSSQTWTCEYCQFRMHRGGKELLSCSFTLLERVQTTVCFYVYVKLVHSLTNGPIIWAFRFVRRPSKFSTCLLPDLKNTNEWEGLLAFWVALSSLMIEIQARQQARHLSQKRDRVGKSGLVVFNIRDLGHNYSPRGEEGQWERSTSS